MKNLSVVSRKWGNFGSYLGQNNIIYFLFLLSCFWTNQNIWITIVPYLFVKHLHCKCSANPQHDWWSTEIALMQQQTIYVSFDILYIQSIMDFELQNCQKFLLNAIFNYLTRGFAPNCLHVRERLDTTLYKKWSWLFVIIRLWLRMIWNLRKP